ncbi:MAG: hypothetical protein M5U27_10025 [Gaiella sp.]|nr:hypothetical protein [Gaiella sp.]
MNRFDEVAIFIVPAQVPESLDAHETLVFQKPVERLIEEAGIASPDLEGEEQKRFRVRRPLIAPAGRCEDAELRPLVPGERRQPACDVASKRRG